MMQRSKEIWRHKIRNLLLVRVLARVAANVLQLPEVRIFETVFYRTAYNKAKYIIDICKAKIIVFRGSDRFCKCRSRIPAFLVGAVTCWALSV